MNNVFYNYLALIHALKLQTYKIMQHKNNTDNSPKTQLINKYLIKYRNAKIKNIKKKIVDLFNTKHNIVCADADILEYFNKDNTKILVKIKHSKLRKFVTKKVENMFSKNENYGTCLDLRFLCLYYNIDYRKILFKINQFDFLVENDFKCLFLLSQLKKYLERFILKSRPEISKQTVKKMYKYAEYNQRQMDIFEKNVFCTICAKSIARCVFKYHANGKIHITKRSNIIDGKYNEAVNRLNYIQKKCLKFYMKSKEEYIETTSLHINKLEAKIKLLLTFLENELKLSISTCNSQNLKETKKEKKRYNMKTYENAKGEPLPTWLHRKYGYDIVFICEICKNAKFNGRKEFDEHFYGKKHASYLEEFGITSDFHKYYGISSISNLRALNDKLKRSYFF